MFFRPVRGNTDFGSSKYWYDGEPTDAIEQPGFDLGQTKYWYNGQPAPPLEPQKADFSVVATTTSYALTFSPANTIFGRGITAETVGYFENATGGCLYIPPGVVEYFAVGGQTVEMLFPNNGITVSSGDASFPYKVIRRTP